jgi:hypothetical protein
MDGMGRRVHILLDPGRHGRVTAEAEQSGRTVAAVIREAIDLRYPPAGAEARMRAAADLLAVTATPSDAPGQGPAELKEAYARSSTETIGHR